MFLNQLLSAVPDPSPEAPADLEEKVNQILGLGLWIVIAACVAGVLIVSVKMALAFRRGDLGESFGALGGVGIACILGASASGFVQFLVA